MISTSRAASPALVGCPLDEQIDAERLRRHALRHAAAIFLVEDGVGPKHIAAFMGHADIQTTFNTYRRLFPENQTLMTSMNRVSERFSVAQEGRKSLQAAK